MELMHEESGKDSAYENDALLSFPHFESMRDIKTWWYKVINNCVTKHPTQYWLEGIYADLKKASSTRPAPVFL